MKRLFIIALAIISFAIASCQKAPEVGGTAVQEASGDWFVNRYMVMDDGTIMDYFGPEWIDFFDGKTGKFHLITYNTSDNKADELFIDEQGEFYYRNMAMYLDFKVKAKVDLANLTFSADAAENFYEDNTVDIQGGIIKNGALSAGGKPIDSIWMTVKISDDTDYAATLNKLYGGEYFDQWDHYLITGVRYTGFEADEDQYAE